MLVEDRIVWQIYYEDLSIYTYIDGLWEDAPPRGVLFVVEIQTNGRREIHMGMDYYYMNPMPNGFIDDFLEADVDDHTNLSESAVKSGVWVSDEVWSVVHKNVFGV